MKKPTNNKSESTAIHSKDYNESKKKIHTLKNKQSGGKIKQTSTKYD